MGVVDVMRVVKKIHSEDVVIVKAGTFYNVYERDAVIIAYLFSYKIKRIDGCPNVGFPKSVINKVLNKLEIMQINYIVLDKTHNYEEDKMNFKKDNNYEVVYEKANKQLNISKRIEFINEYLMKNIEKEDIKNVLKQMEQIIDEDSKKLLSFFWEKK